MTHTLSSPYSNRLQHGFSLLELSIALAVIGIVVAGGLSMSTSMVDRTAYVQTGNQMDEVDKALAAFVSVNNRLPCPADPALAIGDANFGREQAACAGTATAVGTGAKNVRIGALPVRTLGLRDRMAADEYGNRYTYAVTENLTTNAVSGGYPDPAEAGAITLADTGITDSAYAVVSHGGDAKGSYRYETASTGVACAGAAQDVENCNNDATFRDTRFNRGTVAANWFDDTVRFNRKEILNLTAGGASSGGNEFWAANGDDIYNTNTDNVSVGGGSMGARFNVIGAMNTDAVRIEGGESAPNVLDIESSLGENGIRLITKGTTNSLMIDNVSAGGYGVNVTMNNYSTGLNLNMLAGGTGANIVIDGGDGLGLNVYSDSGANGIQADVWGSDGNQYAVSGFTNGGTGSTFDASAGVQGIVRNSPGWGVYGLHQVAAGEGMGVYGVSQSTTGYGVYGQASAATGVNYGVYGSIASTAATASAVRGTATGTSGANYGGYFTNTSITQSAAAVRGSANGNSGTSAKTYGVYGSTTSQDTTTAGVYAELQGAAGVYGEATNALGVYGRSFSKTGVRGEAYNNAGAAWGGYFTTNSGGGGGVYGEVTDLFKSIGVKGGTAGRFINKLHEGTGVYGKSSGRGSKGGVFIADQSNGAWENVGVYGEATSVGAVTSSLVGGDFIAYSEMGGATPNAIGVRGQVFNGGYGVYCQGGLCGGTTTWTNTSDIRLKEDIHTLDDTHGLDAIRKLRPVTYLWKDTQAKKKGTQVGFIAQEVEQIIPEVVVTGIDQIIDFGNGKKETITNAKAMGYAELTAPLVKAVQQLADKLDALFDSVKKLFERVDAHDSDIQALKAENAALKNDNAVLKNRLDAIEAKLAN